MKKSNFYYLKKSIKIIKPYTTKIIILLILLISTTLLSIIQPFLLGNLVNMVIQQNWEEGLLLLTIFLIIMISTMLLNLIYQYLNGLTGLNIGLDMKSLLFHKILSKSENDFNKEDKGKFITNMEDDVNELVSMVTQKFTIILDVFKVLITGVILFKINWILAIIMYVSFPIAFFIFIYFGRLLSSAEHKFKEKKDIYNSFLQESFLGFLTIKVFSIEKFLLNNLKEINKDVFDVSLKKIKLNTYSSLVNEFINILLYAIFGFTAFLEIIRGNLSIGIFISFNSYASTFNGSLYNITKMNSEVQKYLISIKRLIDLIECNEENRKLAKIEHDKILQNDTNIISISNLNFKHNNQNIIFNDFKYNITKGTVIGLCGKNGAGKTTLLKILRGLNTNYDGCIYLYNKNIKDLSSTVLNNFISYVTQENFLFSKSIQENLILNNTNITKEKIIEICNIVGMHSKIKNLPNQYETILKKDNINLSGGEVQRLCIARALLKEADIYLFDEVTSAIDINSKKLIIDIINNLKLKNKTVIIVSHDNEILSNCDKLLDLNIKRKGLNYEYQF